MKAYIDKLSANLIDQYKLYIETFTVDLWSDHGLVEFHVGYALRSDHKMRDFVIKVEAAEAIDDVERRSILAALFVEIEDAIDAAIAGEMVAAN